MIQVENIHKTYHIGDIRVPVLKGISLQINRGEFVAVMGPSGSGKSTFMNIIGCLDTLDTGKYTLNGIPIDKANDDDLAYIRNSRLGFIFQQFNLIPRFSSQRNVELPMVFSSISSKLRSQRAASALERVGLSSRADHSPAQLSGGQQQRVAIARAIVNDPDILIADEPTGSLDTKTSADIMSLFCELHASGKTIMMVTHEEDIAAYAHRIVRLRDGMIDKDERCTRPIKSAS